MFLTESTSCYILLVRRMNSWETQSPPDCGDCSLLSPLYSVHLSSSSPFSWLSKLRPLVHWPHTVSHVCVYQWPAKPSVCLWSQPSLQYNTAAPVCSPQDLLSHQKGFRPHQASSVDQPCLTLCDPLDWSTPGFPVYHQLPELAQTHVHQVSDAIQKYKQQHNFSILPT